MPVPIKQFSIWRILLPIVLGLGVVGYMLYSEFDPVALESIRLRPTAFFWFLIGFLAMFIRDFGYMLRLRILTDNQLSWWSTFKVIMLWEFTSTITPSAVGGTSVAILYINKGGLSVGRSSAVVMATSFLDELYFIIMFPLLLVLLDNGLLFGIDPTHDSIWKNEFFYFASIGYLLKFLYTLLLSYGLFINPRGLKWALLRFFKLRFFRKWRFKALDAGEDIVKSSRALIRKPITFWIKAFAATFFSWTARYWVVNAMLLAFFSIDHHFAIFARQLVMWIMMLVSPTPGGSGFAEFVFTRYLSDFIPVTPEALGMVAVAMAFFWRIITYYPYLIMGIFILPAWIKRNFRKSNVRDAA